MWLCWRGIGCGDDHLSYGEVLNVCCFVSKTFLPTHFSTLEPPFPGRKVDGKIIDGKKIDRQIACNP